MSAFAPDFNDLEIDMLVVRFRLQEPRVTHRKSRRMNDINKHSSAIVSDPLACRAYMKIEHRHQVLPAEQHPNSQRVAVRNRTDRDPADRALRKQSATESCVPVDQRPLKAGNPFPGPSARRRQRGDGRIHRHLRDRGPRKAYACTSMVLPEERSPLPHLSSGALARPWGWMQDRV